MRFFQMGLGSSAEFAYLASRDSSCYEKSRKPLHRVPPPLTASCHWEGVLMEAHPYAFYESYRDVQMRFPDALPNLTFLLGAVSIDDTQRFMPFKSTEWMEHHLGWTLPNVEQAGYTQHPLLERRGETKTKFHVATYSVEDLLKEFGEPDFIALDMEGYELVVLAKLLETTEIAAYQVEAHSIPDTQMIQAMFHNYDYEVVHAVRMVNDRCEMQAIKRTQSATQGVQVLNPTMDSRAQV